MREKRFPEGCLLEVCRVIGKWTTITVVLNQNGSALFGDRIERIGAPCWSADVFHQADVHECVHVLATTAVSSASRTIDGVVEYRDLTGAQRGTTKRL